MAKARHFLGSLVRNADNAFFLALAYPARKHTRVKEYTGKDDLNLDTIALEISDNFSTRHTTATVLLYKQSSSQQILKIK